MPRIEHKAMPSFELSDMDKEHRTAVIAHAVYDNIDRYGDISRKGMFNKSWKETKAEDIRFDVDHDATQQPGLVKATTENDKKAFTKVWFGTHTLGNDTMLMMDEGIIRGASFEFVTNKKADLSIKGKKVRELKEVKHIATTVTLSLPPVNPLAGVVSVTKAGILTDIPPIELKALTKSEFEMLKKMDSMDQQCMQMMVDLASDTDKSSDLYNWVIYQISRRADMMGSARSQMQYNAGEMKAIKDHLQRMEKFVRNTNASDDCIGSVYREIEETKSIISTHDTASTRQYSEPDASVKEFRDALKVRMLRF